MAVTNYDLAVTADTHTQTDQLRGMITELLDKFVMVPTFSEFNLWLHKCIYIVQVSNIWHAILTIFERHLNNTMEYFICADNFGINEANLLNWYILDCLLSYEFMCVCICEVVDTIISLNFEWIHQ